ncbi:tRNA pseudouridine(55) synthase TruB [bacterium E08(2017)]|nr:tRNA pseudouridine(55) synthase TruB [bacterium E08(2017)]
MSDPFDGVLVVDKPAGPTSHDVVDAIRKQFGIKKVGHGGTLDPQATGVLVILTGKGTKLSNRFMSSDKVYEGTIRLGSATNTQDAQGETISEGDYSNVTREDMERVMEDFKGDIMQLPPMVSAVKIDGVPLYKRARKGEEVERKERLIHIYELVITEFGLPDSTFRVKCTKGTYVRTICADIGEKLGCGAHLSQLRRTESGTVTLEQAIPFDEVMKKTRDELMDDIIPIHKFAARVPGDK